MKFWPRTCALMLLMTASTFLAAQPPHGQIQEREGPLPINKVFPLLGVPVGTILPYAGPLEVLPAQWQPCDGRVIRDPDSPLDGVRLPDLTDDRFLMGVAAPDTVGSKGGTNEIPFEGNHAHSGTATERVRHASSTPHYGTTRGDKGFKHSHDLSIRTDGGHGHGRENRPQFYAVRFIIRVK